MTLEALATLLSGYKFRPGSEGDLQRGVQRVLVDNRVPFIRELPLNVVDRIDFLLTDDGIGLELKTKGSPSATLEQLLRYTTHERVRALMLLTTKPTLEVRADVLGGKPFRSLVLPLGLA